MTISSNQLYSELRAGINNRYQKETIRDSFPKIIGYLHASRDGNNEFLQHVLDHLNLTGSLTAKQIVAVAKTQKAEAGPVPFIDPNESAEIPIAPAPRVTVQRLVATPVEEMFKNVALSGKENASFTAGMWKIKVSKAGECLWVTHEGVLVGRIMGGFFQSMPHMKDHLYPALKNLLTDPKAVAKQHGDVTGSCSCCSRTLTDPISVERGIGPVCEGRWFPSSEPRKQSKMEDLGLVMPKASSRIA